MTVYSGLDAVSVGVYSALNVSPVTSLATGGLGDDIAQGTAFPFVLYEVHERPQFHMGSQPGRSGQLLEIELLVHVFAQDTATAGAMKTAQQVLDAVVGVLVSPPTVTGFSSWACFFDEAINLGDQLVAGIKVKELVGRFRLFVELQ